MDGCGFPSLFPFKPEESFKVSLDRYVDSATYVDEENYKLARIGLRNIFIVPDLPTREPNAWIRLEKNYWKIDIISLGCVIQSL